MRRLVLVGLGLGAVNALAAALTLLAVFVYGPEVTFTYFGYGPPDDLPFTVDRYGFPTEQLFVPGALLVLNAVLVPLAVRLGLLRLDR